MTNSYTLWLFLIFLTKIATVAMEIMKAKVNVRLNLKRYNHCIYLGFYVAFNTVVSGHMARQVVLWAEETSTDSWCQGSVL